MADESISIEITDKVDASISTKLKGMASDSRTAYDAVTKLQGALNSLNSGALSAIITNSQSAAAALAQTTLASQKLATEQQRTATAAANAAAAQTRATTAQTQGATAAQNLNAATARANTAQTQGATAAAKLATEQQRTATQAANAAAAQDRAALAALRLQQAQDKAAKSSTDSANALLGFVKNAALFAGVALTADGIVKLADSTTLLNNKLANLTTSVPQAQQLLERLYDVADKTRVPIDDTVSAFQRFDNALKRGGASQEDTIRIVQSLNELIATSGANATEASNGLVQLSQAFGAGKLQGQDLRAIMEDIPAIAQQIASKLTVTNGVVKVTNNGVGISVGLFRQLATQGKLTADTLKDALLASGDEIDQKFSKTIPTISQSLTILENNAKKAFGEFNEATGFSKALSSVIVTLANNLKTVAVVAATVGAALLVAFGPTILAAITAATVAAWDFTAALLANPIGLIVVGIAAATTALALFGDQVKLGIDDTTTLGDLGVAIWDDIKDAASATGSFIAGLWSDMVDGAKTALDSITSDTSSSTDSWSSDYEDFFKTQDSGWAGALEVVAKTIDAIAGLITGLGISIARVFTGLPDLFRNIFADVYNAVVTKIQDMINAAIDGVNKIASLVGKDLVDHVQLETKQVDDAYWKKYGQNIAAGIDAGFDSQGGFMQNAVKGLLNQAKQVGANRLKNQQPAAALRGRGPNQNNDMEDKGAEKRSKSLAEVNLQLNNQLASLGMLAPARELQQKYDQIEQSLAKKGITLTAQETQSIKDRLAAIQQGLIVQAKMDSIYEQATGPSRDYNATLQAAQKLLNMGAISQQQYNGVVANAAEVYKAASDPLYQLNKDLDQQISLLKLLPQQRQIEQQIMQAQNEALAKNHVLTQQEIADLRQKLTLQQQMNLVSQQEASLLSNSVDKRQANKDQVTAISNLKNNPQSGFTQGDAANASMTALKNSGIDTTGFAEQSQAYVQQYADMYSQIDQLRQANLISEQTAAGATAQVWALQQKNQLSGTTSFLGNLASLMNTHNKTQFKIGKAAAIAQAGINTYLSATEAFASLAGIPIVGPILGGIAAAAAVAAGLAQIQSIRQQQMTGYQAGGYTGNMAQNEIAGVVHGQEYVSTARATAQYRPQLEAMNRGTYDAGNYAQGKSPNVNVQPVVVPAPSIRLINVSSQEEARNFANSDENEQVVLNILHKNGMG